MAKQKVDITAPMPSANAIVATRGKDGFDNALIVGYACNCSFDPPMIMVGIVPSRYSYKLIEENPHFVVHFAREDQRDAWQYLGSNSGEDEDKLAKLGLEVRDGDEVNAPVITDFPVAIECEVVDSIETGSHVMYAGEIKAIHADEDLVNDNGKLDMSLDTII
ncbi:MAG: flavin reductase family protein [Armatimonadota bacterium]